MRRDYRVKTVQLRNSINGSKKKQILLEALFESKKLELTKILLLKNIDELIERVWGKFGKEFIIHHIVQADRLVIARSENIIVGISAASNKKVLHHNILYLEFTAIAESFQGYNLTTIMNAFLIMDEYLNGFIQRLGRPLEVFTITRNLRVIGALQHYASYIYPDPEQIEKYGHLLPANDETWALAQEIVRFSWNPGRQLLREGNVLIGSYENAPWLITPKVQKHYKKSIRDMGDNYLHFRSGEDREFIVHVKFSMGSIIKYLSWKFFKNVR